MQNHVFKLFALHFTAYCLKLKFDCGKIDCTSVDNLTMPNGRKKTIFLLFPYLSNNLLFPCLQCSPHVFTQLTN